jgi:hypothetical protein
VEPKRARPFPGEIVNNAAVTQRQRQSKTYGGCKICNIYLCVKGACFEQYHRKSNNKQLADASIVISMWRQAFFTLIGGHFLPARGIVSPLSKPTANKALWPARE